MWSTARPAVPQRRPQAPVLSYVELPATETNGRASAEPDIGTGHRPQDDTRTTTLRLVGPGLLAQVARPLLPAEPWLTPVERERVERAVVAFLFAQIGSMPTFLRLPYEVALQAFNWLAFLRYGRRYAELEPGRQRAYLRLWSTSPLGPGRDLVKLVRSCALLQFFDHPLVQARLESRPNEVDRAD